MPGSDDGLGKKAELKIKQWLDHPELGYSFDRIPDQMSGRYLVSRNICDFICFKSPNLYYIESKATWSDRFDFSRITTFQSEGLTKKSEISFCFGLIIVLFAAYQRAPGDGTPRLQAVVFHEVHLEKVLQGFVIASRFSQATAYKEQQVEVFGLHGFHFLVAFQRLFVLV